VSPNLRQRLVALSGEDKPGIMHAVSSFFADKGINILSMNVYNGARTATLSKGCLTLTQTQTAHTPHTHKHCTHARTHDTEPAPFASSRLFKLQALVQVPQGMSDDQLAEGIDAVGEKEDVDMWLESSQPSTPPAALHEAAPQSQHQA